MYVNGQKVESHVGGYDHFEFDVADAISVGAGRNSSPVSTTRPMKAKRSANSTRTTALFVEIGVRVRSPIG